MSQTFVANAQHIIAFSLIATLDNGSLISIEGGSGASASVLAFNGTTPLLMAIQLAS